MGKKSIILLRLTVLLVYAFQANRNTSKPSYASSSTNDRPSSYAPNAANERTQPNSSERPTSSYLSNDRLSNSFGSANHRSTINSPFSSGLNHPKDRPTSNNVRISSLTFPGWRKDILLLSITNRVIAILVMRKYCKRFNFSN